MPKKSFNLEQTFQRLEEIVERLESENLPIDEMVSIYEEGMNLVRGSQKYLQTAQQKIQTISPAGKNQNSTCES
ncbi:exodeoxyribonuclease VII small subunit [bacterium]|nr:exodeoxyribonuclease VII small subunit [bacterium]